MINKAINAKLHYFQNGQGYTHKFYDALIFNKIRAILGGRIRFMAVGSAPIEAHVLDFLKIAFCCTIVEGYGMTECPGTGLMNLFDHPESGVVGGPNGDVKMRLKSLPEMNYLITDNPPRGEICLFGPCVTSGYFLNPEKTAETIIDGWLHTGDVGVVYPHGAVKIIDRAKNIFKLSQGEYIAPEKLEKVYGLSQLIQQIWVYGDSF